MPPLPRPVPSRRQDLLIAALAGAACAVVTARRSGDPECDERLVFRTVNRAGGRLAVLRVPQQLGTPWVLPGLALVAAATGRRRLAVASTLALPLEKAGEVVTKKLAQRPRPAQTAADARLRDDAPTEGPGYPSGHAALSACATVLWHHCVPWPVAVSMVATGATTAYTRVHQGAHYPADVVGGALLGIALGSGLAGVLGARSGR